MDITNHILPDVRGFLGLDKSSTIFDNEIVPHVMGSMGRLSQNGVCISSIVTEDTTWSDIIPIDLITNPEVFSMVPLYVMLSTKIIFDPPPPSAIPYYQSNLDDMLWRLGVAHDTKGVVLNETGIRRSP